jgi:hypothetical protein
VPFGDGLFSGGRERLLAQPVVDRHEQRFLVLDVVGESLGFKVFGRAGDVAGAEAREDARIDLEVPVAGGGGQVEGVIAADDRR